jgi:hypothetical protein
MSGITESDRQKCLDAALKVAGMAHYGKIEIEPIPCDPVGAHTQPGQTPHYTLFWDIPTQFGVMHRRSCRVDETTVEGFVKAVDAELFRMIRAVALMRVILNPNP